MLFELKARVFVILPQRKTPRYKHIILLSYYVIEQHFTILFIKTAIEDDIQLLFDMYILINDIYTRNWVLKTVQTFFF